MSIIINSLFSMDRAQCPCHVKGFSDAFDLEKHLIELILKDFENNNYDFSVIYFDVKGTHENLFDLFDKNSFMLIIRRTFETQISRRLVLCQPKTPIEKTKFKKMREEYRKCITESYVII